jgi:ribonuclease D
MMRYLETLVVQAHKTEIVAQEMHHLLSFTPKPPKQDRWRGVSGIQDIKDQRGLAILRELWMAREQIAEKLDVSPSRLIPDRSISHVAASKPERRSILAADKLFNGRASRTYLDTWWTAIERGRLTNDLPPLRVASSGIPNHRNWAAKFPEADARLRRAREVITQISEEMSIPAENLLTPDYLRALCFEPHDYTEEAVVKQLSELGARSWQIEFLGAALTAALQPQSEELDPQAS